MTNNDNDNNRFGLVGHIEFAQVTDAVKELATMAGVLGTFDALRLVEEAVEELLATIEEQKAEIKRLRTELAQVEMDRDILVQHVQRNSQGGR
jgi:transposase-like protein